MENEDFIILDGIKNVEDLYEKNKCQQNKIHQLEEKNTNLTNQYENYHQLVKNLSLEHSNLKIKYAQQRLQNSRAPPLKVFTCHWRNLAPKACKIISGSSGLYRESTVAAMAFASASSPRMSSVMESENL